MTTITTKQISERKITQTVFIPLARAIELDKAAKRLGISRNKVINLAIDFALEHEDEMMMSSSVGGRATNHTPAAEAVVEATSTSTTNTKEVKVL